MASPSSEDRPVSAPPGTLYGTRDKELTGPSGKNIRFFGQGQKLVNMA
jgi:hypothetical protein